MNSLLSLQSVCVYVLWEGLQYHYLITILPHTICVISTRLLCDITSIIVIVLRSKIEVLILSLM